MQGPGALLGVGLEQACTKRLCEERIVDGDGKPGTSLLAGAAPRRSDFQAFAEDAVVRRILCVRFLGRENSELHVEGERADIAKEAVGVASEGPDLAHEKLLSWV